MMTGLLLSGAGFGALHAVSGPDHLLSLGPLALASSSSRPTDEAGELNVSAQSGLRPSREFRRGAALGGLWGLGHGVGTVALAAPVLFFAARSEALLRLLRVVGDGLAGVALIVLGALALWKLRTPAPVAAASSRTGPLAVGLVHGVSGAGGLLVALPWLVSGPWSSSAAFLAAFVVSSSLSMAAVSGGVARLGQRLSSRMVARAQRVLAWGSVALGALWLVL